MADAGTLRFLLPFGREIERVTQKNICVSLVPRVAPHNGIKRFGKSNFLHGMKKARLRRARKHNRQTPTGQLRAVNDIACRIKRWSWVPIIPSQKSRSGLQRHRDTPRAGRVAWARAPAIGSPP